MSTVPEPTVSQFDMEDQRERHRVNEREHELAVETAKQKGLTRRKRWETTGYIVIALVIASAVCTFTYLIWQANKGPSANAQLQHDEQVTCINNGGVYTQLGADGSGKTCVFMKETTP